MTSRASGSWGPVPKSSLNSFHDPWSKEGRIWHLYPGNDAPGNDSPDKDALGNDAPGKDGPGNDDPGNDAPGNYAFGDVSIGNDALQKILKCLFEMLHNILL